MMLQYQGDRYSREQESLPQGSHPTLGTQRIKYAGSLEGKGWGQRRQVGGRGKGVAVGERREPALSGKSKCCEAHYGLPLPRHGGETVAGPERQRRQILQGLVVTGTVRKEPW